MKTRRALLLVVCLVLLPAALSALELEASTPADDATGVPPDVRIDLTFSNNVVDPERRELNTSKIVLLGPAGELIPFTAEMADPRANPERRRNIVVVPAQPLEASTTYVVVVLPGLAARNGSSIASAIAITFTTAAE